MKKSLSILLCAFLLLSLVACSAEPVDTPESTEAVAPQETAASTSETPAQTSGDPVYIGCILPLSGTTAYDGESAQKGALTAVKYINDNGGVLGEIGRAHV